MAAQGFENSMSAGPFFEWGRDASQDETAMV